MQGFNYSRWQRFIPLGVILVLIVATSWSLVTRGFFFTHDILPMARIAELWRAVAAGQFPPRWSQNFGFGYGIPLFEFYAPLPYVMGALLYGGHVPELLIFKLLFLVPNVVSIVGGYVLGKHYYGRKGGLLVAAAFGLAPYRSVDLFVRGAVSESWGLMTFPWILWGISLVIQHRKMGQGILLTSLIVLFLSHNITSLLFLPLAIGFAVIELAVLWVKNATQVSRLKALSRSLVRLLGILLLAILTSAFYLFPAFLEKNSVQIQTTISDYYRYSNHFLYLRQFVIPFWGYGASVWGPNDGLSFFLGYGWWLMAGLAALSLLVWAGLKLFKKLALNPQEKTTLIRIGGWGLLSLGSLVMTLEKSNSIWSAISPLQFAQFPWRFLGCLAIFTALTLVAIMSLVKSRNLTIVFSGAALVVLVATQTIYFQPNPAIPDDATLYTSDPAYIQAKLGASLTEYLPKGIPLTPSIADQRLKILSGGQVMVTHDQLGHYQVTATSPANSQAIWQVANFPGWQTKLDGQSIKWTVTDQGLMTIPVPAGIHTLNLDWGESPIRLVSDVLSAIGLMLIAAVIWYSLKRTH